MIRRPSGPAVYRWRVSWLALRAAAAAVLCLVLTPGLASEAAGPRGPCWPPESTTLAKSSQVRAYTYLDPLSDPDRPEITLDACHFRTGRTASLADARAGVFFYPGPAVHVNGPVVGYALQVDDEPSVLLEAERVPDGNARRRWRIPNLKLGSVRATRGGGLAFIQCPVEPDASPPDARPECVAPRFNDVVRVIECDGTRRVLARGRGIDPWSLQLLPDDRTLVWLKHSKRRTGRFRVTCGAPELQDPDGPGPLSGAPSISGEPRVGVHLRPIPGLWSLQPSFAYRWFRCDQAGQGCRRIPLRGRAGSYQASAADVGSRLRFEVIARDFGGAATAGSALTEPVAPIPAQR